MPPCGYTTRSSEDRANVAKYYLVRRTNELKALSLREFGKSAASHRRQERWLSWPTYFRAKSDEMIDGRQRRNGVPSLGIVRQLPIHGALAIDAPRAFGIIVGVVGLMSAA